MALCFRKHNCNLLGAYNGGLMVVLGCRWWRCVKGRKSRSVSGRKRRRSIGLKGKCIGWMCGAVWGGLGACSGRVRGGPLRVVATWAS